MFFGFYIGIMKKQFLLCCLSLLLVFATIKKATAQYIKDINGRPIMTKAYSEIEGTVFLIDQWSKGKVKFADGRTFNDVLLKYNVLDDELSFQNNEQTLAFVEPIREFELTYISENKSYKKLFRSGYKDIPGSDENSFFEVMSDGTVQLLKKTTKVIQETKQYNGPITKSFDESSKLYLIISGKPTQIKKDKKTILTLLGNKQPELESYIKANNLNIKDDADVAKLITYYNSI